MKPIKIKLMVIMKTFNYKIRDRLDINMKI